MTGRIVTDRNMKKQIEKSGAVSRSRLFPHGMIVLLAALTLFGCSNEDKLTSEQAEAALKRWMANCNPKVTGIHELPGQSAATVNVQFSNFRFTRNERVLDQEKMAFSERPVPKQYSGPGIATFTHFNDGRWVLTGVTTSQGPLSTYWNDLNVEAN